MKLENLLEGKKKKYKVSDLPIDTHVIFKYNNGLLTGHIINVDEKDIFTIKVDNLQKKIFKLPSNKVFAELSDIQDTIEPRIKKSKSELEKLKNLKKALSIGTRVIIAADNDNPEERGVVTNFQAGEKEITNDNDSNTVIVKLDRRYWADENDDGVRDVPLDSITIELKKKDLN